MASYLTEFKLSSDVTGTFQNRYNWRETGWKSPFQQGTYCGIAQSRVTTFEKYFEKVDILPPPIVYHRP